MALDRVNQYRAEGRSREESIVLAGRDRLRPILMTALTTILGLLPLALGKSGVGGWAYYYPLARTVMGGLLSSTLLTLIVLPYINYGLENVATWAASTPPCAKTSPRLWGSSPRRRRLRPVASRLTLFWPSRSGRLGHRRRLGPHLSR